MFYHKKLVVIVVLFAAHSIYASQKNKQSEANKIKYKLPAATEQQIAGYKALEKKPAQSAPLYFFHDQDLDGPAQSSKKPTIKSLYARYNDLHTPLQDYITSFLVKTKWSDEKDPQTGALKVIEDEKWKKSCKKRFNIILSSQGSISFKETEFIKKLLRIEYWLRFVRRARHEHTMINNRMEPSALVVEEPYLIEKFLNAAYFDQYYHGDIGIDFIGLIIGCGILVNQKKNSRSLLVPAIQDDDVEVIRLLRNAGLTQPYGSLSSNSTAMHVAAESNATQSIRYLYRKGCDLDAKDDRGYTPLNRAYYFKHHDAVSLLIELGADENIKDNCEKEQDADTALCRAFSFST
ncbi:MAG: ankyrin repeat domain-containing protein [Candidatus Chromulinivorax sp.]|nr:ankyrin repeat domain-containing protein [Candidatus Chromulinivorax sp.]